MTPEACRLTWRVSVRLTLLEFSDVTGHKTIAWFQTTAANIYVANSPVSNVPKQRLNGASEFGSGLRRGKKLSISHFRLVERFCQGL